MLRPGETTAVREELLHLPPFACTLLMVLMVYKYSTPVSTPISLNTTIPASFAAASRARMAGEMYEVMTTCVWLLMAAVMTVAWWV